MREELTDEMVEREVRLAFAPLHKAALGIAVGVALGGTLFLLTALKPWLDPDGRTSLLLLRQYFVGYDESLVGALVGGAWGFLVGGVAGWFVAFVRNLVLAAWLLVVRARAELEVSADFLDHI